MVDAIYVVGDQALVADQPAPTAGSALTSRWCSPGAGLRAGHHADAYEVDEQIFAALWLGASEPCQGHQHQLTPAVTRRLIASFAAGPQPAAGDPPRWRC